MENHWSDNDLCMYAKFKRQLTAKKGSMPSADAVRTPPPHSSIHFPVDAGYRITKLSHTYPVIFCDLRFWYSTSSTVHTAPFTFSTRTKHLCRLRL